MSGSNKDDKTVESRINIVAASIESRLKPGLSSDGKIDLDLLKDKDAELHEVLSRFAESKTWRDDPTISARDVAKLLEAQSKETPLGSALDKLKGALEK